MKIDRAFMTEQGIDLTTPMIVTNGAELEMSISQEEKAVTYGDSLITIKR